MQVADSSDASVLLVFVVLGALLVGWGVFWFSRAPKRWFHKHYGIDLPRAYNVRWSRGSAIRFELVPPAWAHSRVDGTRDGRYASNSLVWRPSVLFDGDVAVSALDPVDLYRLVVVLRDRGYQVPWSSQELSFMNEAVEIRSRMRAVDSAASLFASFDGDPRAFELWCAEVLAREGWDATPTPQTNDGGYDVVLRGRRGTGAVECKLYAPGRSVGRPIVQQLVGAARSIRASVVIVMTTGYFTSGAVQYAREQGVELRDGEALAELVDGMAGDLDDDIDFGSEILSVEDVRAGYPLDWRDERSIWGSRGSGAKTKTKSTGLNIMLGVVLSPFIFAFLLGVLSAMIK